MAACVKGFGCQAIVGVQHKPGPVSETLHKNGHKTHCFLPTIIGTAQRHLREQLGCSHALTTYDVAAPRRQVPGVDPVTRLNARLKAASDS